jgi:hypothetical protein
MKYMVWLPLFGNGLIAVGLPALDRRLPHRRKPAVLAGTAVVGAACWLWCLVLLAAMFAHQLDRLAVRGGRAGAASASGASAPTPELLTAVATAVLAGTMIRLSALGARHTRELVHAERLRRLPAPGDVIDLPDTAPRACAVGGLGGGRITITSGMRRCLTDAEQAAVLAHERAHLAAGHHWLRMAAAWCAAVSPPMRRLPELVELACERAADEEAAARVGDRRLVARALGQAALATVRHQRAARSGPARSAVEASFVHGAVTERMAALLEEPPPPPRVAVAAALSSAVGVVMVVAVVHASTDCLGLLGY